jgi:hypothetical protein
LDYAEHAIVLALAEVLAVCRGPGWRILIVLCGAVWLYLGLVAALVLPHHPRSWGSYRRCRGTCGRRRIRQSHLAMART